MRRLIPLIVGLALILRLVGLASYPIGFTPDEASFGYDAYSLLKTGHDQWGVSWPLVFRSFGDSKLPVYTYLAMPSVALFGLNEFAVRLPNALLGAFAVFATYLMVRELFRREDLALVSAALLAISPWQMALSRGAFEANLTTFFMPLGVWAFLKGIKNRRFMILSALLFGINIFTYHSARFVTPLIVLALAVLFRNELGFARLSTLKKVFVKNLIPIAIFIFFLGLAFYTVFSGGGSRASDLTIFNPTDKWSYMAERRLEAVLLGMPAQIARIFSNKIVYVFDRFSSAYVTYFSPQFLFTEGTTEWTYGMIPGRGVLYLVEMPFVLMGIWSLAKKGFKENKAMTFIILWILASPLPASLSKGLGLAANRAAVMMPALQVFSAFGGIALYEALLKNKHLSSKLLKGVFIAVFSFALIVFLEDYYYHAPIEGASSMLFGRRQAVLETNFRQARYDKLIFSKGLSEPQIYVAFYTAWDPTDYQKQSASWLRYEAEGLPFVDQLGEYSLGKYIFKGIDYTNDSKTPNVLIVGQPKEFPADITPNTVINYPNNEPAIYIVDPAQVTTASL